MFLNTNFLKENSALDLTESCYSAHLTASEWEDDQGSTTAPHVLQGNVPIEGQSWVSRRIFKFLPPTFQKDAEVVHTENR